MIVGFYIGLEGPSWEGARQALFNAMRNKVELCREFGIHIEPEEWPCEHVCHNITSDRGELTAGFKIRLFDTLSVDTVSFNPPYRADCKGLVERNFHTLNENIIHFLPGGYHRAWLRGDKRPELDAALTIEEFTRIIIAEILWLNKHTIKDNILTSKMVEDGVKPLPIDVWNWGLENMTGDVVHRTEEEKFLGLLPQDEASVTREGIVFDGMTYTCERAIREDWYAKARKKRWRIPVLYMPSTDYIWYVDKINGGIETCQLQDWQEIYKNRRREEVLDLLEIQKIDNKAYEQISRQANLEKMEKQGNIVKQAKQEKREAIKEEKPTKSKRLSGKKENRKNEKVLGRVKTRQSVEKNILKKPEKKIKQNVVDINERKKRKETAELLKSLVGEKDDE